ncbi:uncharacterized protein PHACADRAFT_264726 [Phanerochaete carnosa HHB-10118-sp]|uniref:AB hydrolase-1 domain-containing protein n=1 Tax=Phanerochaete carnosa (strain HHB-10118-sp) TaxID=650164 RepID=K5WIT2_PHACS|nr:uncharacterized protein PHACADRAFT_264726 [Phanerochaete carnosa HHB-10118-sp]EKM50157.1 hypothetical protein PHACADRAFT_264726 [Phanerochaete carnosa HHB-10118-sp]
MPTAPVDNNGTVLFFEDTGAPPGSSTYLTVILLHGLLFHGAIFQKLVPHAASNDLRLVRVNLRDYPGSTKFSEEELDVIKSGEPEKQAGAMKAQGQQLAAFLRHFATTYDIPPTAQADGKLVGGMALLTWSMSNNLATSLLAHAASLSAETREVLSNYLRTILLLDPVLGSTCGEGAPQGSYHPFRDASLSMDERIDFSEVWLSYYFSTVDDFKSITPEELSARSPLHESSLESPPDSSKTPTLLRVSKEVRYAIRDRDAFVRSSLPILRITPNVFRENFERALFRTDGTMPAIRIVYAWCDETMGDSISAAKFTWDRLEASRAEGSRFRDIEFCRLDGCNHIPHWDYPEKIIRLFTTRA